MLIYIFLKNKKECTEKIPIKIVQVYLEVTYRKKVEVIEVGQRK